MLFYDQANTVFYDDTDIRRLSSLSSICPAVCVCVPASVPASFARSPCVEELKGFGDRHGGGWVEVSLVSVATNVPWGIVVTLFSRECQQSQNCCCCHLLPFVPFQEEMPEQSRTAPVRSS